MNTFFISDTHWGHKNIIEYSKRPFSSVEEMNEALIKNWNDTVSPEDTVWHLGDVAFCKYSELKVILARLNGHKNLVLGNHDKMITSNKQELLDLKLFDSIQHYAEVTHSGAQRIILFHYGMRVWNGSHHGNILLYGHSHGSLPPFGRSVDVGVDCKEISKSFLPKDYRPLSLQEVLDYMKNKTGETVDHHKTRR
jgi:calcineurin-like phosphoesterase family protein